MVLAKTEVIESLDQAIKLEKELERVELKASLMLFGITLYLHRGNLTKRE